MDISEFKRLKETKSYPRHPWEIARIKTLLTILKGNKLKFPVKRVVDIGGGDAYVINKLYKENIAEKYFAIDIAYTEEIISQLKQNNPNSQIVYLQNLEEYNAKYSSEESTLYLCMDVLEHLSDEKEVLSHIDKKEDDYYFFSVPAFQSVFSNHDVLLGHFRRYTLSQLTALCKSYGFSIKDNGYYFTTLLAFRWLEKKLNKNKEYSIDNWEGSNAKTNMIVSVLNLDFFFTNLLKKIGIKFPGLSCYCLCKK